MVFCAVVGFGRGNKKIPHTGDIESLLTGAYSFTYETNLLKKLKKKVKSCVSCHLSHVAFHLSPDHPRRVDDAAAGGLVITRVKIFPINFFVVTSYLGLWILTFDFYLLPAPRIIEIF